MCVLFGGGGKVFLLYLSIYAFLDIFVARLENLQSKVHGLFTAWCDNIMANSTDFL